MIEAGLVLSGKYQLVREIGRGGMGSVWLAKRLDLNADVAVKVMRTDAAGKPGALARFRREARSAAALRSPHVVQILDCGVDAATGVAFISMELLDGESLAERLARVQPLPAAEVASIVAQVARGLARAHGAGIIHRDLKPANIFLVKNEDAELAKLLDFGIAKDGGGSAHWRTSTGTVVGTPHYMSPEQIDPARPVDYRTDLWSLGVIACEAMVGKRPFEADTLSELALKISLGRSRVPSSLGSVPSGFDEWFARATHLDPEQRFQSALELGRALCEVCAQGAALPQGGTFSLGATEEIDSFEGVANGQRLARHDASWASRGERAPISARALLWLTVTGLILAVLALGSVLRLEARDVRDEPATVTPLTGAAFPRESPLAQGAVPSPAAPAPPPSREPTPATVSPPEVPAASAEPAPVAPAQRKPAPRAAVVSERAKQPPPGSTSIPAAPSAEAAPQQAPDPFDLQ